MPYSFKSYLSILSVSTLIASTLMTIPKAQAQDSPQSLFTTTLETAAQDAKAGAVLNVQGCGVSFNKASGVANRKAKTPMPSGEQLRIASVSKIYTASVVHSLDHTSGIPDYYDWKSYFFWDWTQPISPEKTLLKASKRKATNAVGEAYSYSNTNYQILALTAEAVTGKPFSQLIEEYILTPLELNNTRYNTQHPGGTIHGYGMKIRRGADTWKYAENTGADGGVTATTADLSGFLSAVFLDDGALQNIGTAMKTTEVEKDGTRQYAILGAEVIETRSGYKLYGHTGDTYGYLTFAYAVPKFNATIIGHMNADKPDVFVKFLSASVKTLDSACKAR